MKEISERTSDFFATYLLCMRRYGTCKFGLVTRERKLLPVVARWWWFKRLRKSAEDTTKAKVQRLRWRVPENDLQVPLRIFHNSNREEKDVFVTTTTVNAYLHRVKKRTYSPINDSVLVQLFQQQEEAVGGGAWWAPTNQGHRPGWPPCNKEISRYRAVRASLHCLE